MYKLSIDRPQDGATEPYLILEGPEGEQKIPLDRAEAYQLFGKIDVFSTGNPGVIENFPAPDANFGGDTPFGTLTSWPIQNTATPDAIRQTRLKPVEKVIGLIIAGARTAHVTKPTISTVETVEDVLEDGPRLAIPENVLLAIRERVEASLVKEEPTITEIVDACREVLDAAICDEIAAQASTENALGLVFTALTEAGEDPEIFLRRKNILE